MGPLLFVRREEPLEAEAPCVHAGHRERRDERAGTGEGGHPDSLLNALPGDDLPGVRDDRCPSIGDKGDVLALPKVPVNQLPRLLVLVVLVIACERLSDAVVVEEPERISRILCRNQVHSPQRLKDPLRDVLQVSDGCCTQVQGSGFCFHPGLLLLSQ